MHIVFTGGTISCDSDLAPSSKVVGKIIDFIGGDSITTSEPFRILSEMARPSDWVSLADHINSIDDDRILVLHGTDSMLYSLNAIDLLCKNKKIVFSGAMDPFTEDSDGARNIMASIEFLKTATVGTFLCFENHYRYREVIRAEDAIAIDDGYFEGEEYDGGAYAIKEINVRNCLLHTAQPISIKPDFSKYDEVLLIPYHSNTFDPSLVNCGAPICVLTKHLQDDYASISDVEYSTVITNNVIR